MVMEMVVETSNADEDCEGVGVRLIWPEGHVREAELR